MNTPVDISGSEMMSKIGIVFWSFAYAHRLKLTSADIAYFENVINRNPVCTLLFHTSQYRQDDLLKGITPIVSADYQSKCICFCEMMLADSKCPAGVRNVLNRMIITFKDGIVRQVGSLDVLTLRRAYINRWFEMCANKKR